MIAACCNLWRPRPAQLTPRPEASRPSTQIWHRGSRARQNWLFHYLIVDKNPAVAGMDRPFRDLQMTPQRSTEVKGQGVVLLIGQRLLLAYAFSCANGTGDRDSCEFGQLVRSFAGAPDGWPRAPSVRAARPWTPSRLSSSSWWGGCAAEMINLEICVRPNRGANPVRRIVDRVSYHSATSPPACQCLDLIQHSTTIYYQWLHDMDSSA